MQTMLIISSNILQKSKKNKVNEFLMWRHKKSCKATNWKLINLMQRISLPEACIKLIIYRRWSTPPYCLCLHTCEICSHKPILILKNDPSHSRAPYEHNQPKNYVFCSNCQNLQKRDYKCQQLFPSTLISLGKRSSTIWLLLLTKAQVHRYKKVYWEYTSCRKEAIKTWKSSVS